MRVVSLENAGGEVFYLEEQTFGNKWKTLKVKDITPSFKTSEEAIHFLEQFKENEIKKVVKEFTL